MSSGSDFMKGAEAMNARNARYEKFFIPYARDEAQAEEILTSIAKFIQRPVPLMEDRIRRVAYKHNGEYYVAEVGQPIDPYYCEEGVVIAIFGGQPLAICTRNRGVERGEPIYVNAHAVVSSKLFGELAPT